MHNEDLNKDQPVIKLSELEKTFIQEGLDDIESEEVLSHEEVMNSVSLKLKD